MSRFPLQEGQWQGHAAYIVGGGESLKSIDWSLLEGKSKILTINRAFVNVPTADLWFTEDLRVVELYHRTPEWKRFEGTRVFHALKPEFGKEAKKMARSVGRPIAIIERRREDKFWSRRFEDGLSLSSNSGVGAINLAWLLGADPIYLLGFDCAGGNYHEDYQKAGFDQAGSFQMDTYRSDFENWVAPHVRDRQVINLTTAVHTSTISSACWPKWDLESTLKGGRPKMIFCDFRVEREVRFDVVDCRGEGTVVPDPTLAHCSGRGEGVAT